MFSAAAGVPMGVGTGERFGRALPSSLLTADEVASLLGVTAAWVYEQSRCGRIPTVTLGRYRRYRREAIEQWVLDLEAASVVGRR